MNGDVRDIEPMNGGPSYCFETEPGKFSPPRTPQREHSAHERRRPRRPISGCTGAIPPQRQSGVATPMAGNSIYAAAFTVAASSPTATQ